MTLEEQIRIPRDHADQCCEDGGPCMEKQVSGPVRVRMSKEALRARLGLSSDITQVVWHPDFQGIDIYLADGPSRSRGPLDYVVYVPIGRVTD